MDPNRISDMQKKEVLYSRFYVHYNQSLGELEFLLANILGGRMNFSTVKVGDISISVMRNDDYDEAKVTDINDGFLSYRYTFEIGQGTNEPNQKTFSQVLGKMLTYFWGNNIPAVACYEFEEDLPERGGYLSPNVPRPT